MSDQAETVATRLWRDRAQLREQERNEAQARARIAEEKVAILMAENDRLATEIARLRAQLMPDAARARAETEQQMEALRTELLSLLDQPSDSSLH
jgi:phage-related minor tail protein